MAGRRRQAGKPLQRDVKKARSLARFQVRMVAAATTAARLGVAIDYARARHLTNPTGDGGGAPVEQPVEQPVGQSVERRLERLVELMTGAAEEIVLARHRQRTAAELAAAATPRDRIAAAARLVRAAAGPAPTGPAAEAAERLVRHLTRDLHTTTGGPR